MVEGTRNVKREPLKLESFHSRIFDDSPDSIFGSRNNTQIKWNQDQGSVKPIIRADKNSVDVVISSEEQYAKVTPNLEEVVNNYQNKYEQFKEKMKIEKREVIDKMIQIGATTFKERSQFKRNETFQGSLENKDILVGLVALEKEINKTLSETKDFPRNDLKQVRSQRTLLKNIHEEIRNKLRIYEKGSGTGVNMEISKQSELPRKNNNRIER